MKVLDAIGAFLYPPRCPLCGTPTRADEPLCPDCRERWDRESALPCPRCSLPASECRCRPAALRNDPSLCAAEFLSVGFYAPAQNPLRTKLVYLLKRKASSGAVSVFARPMAEALESRFAEAGRDAREWIFTYPPRSAHASREAGFDHAARLSRACAKLLGAPQANVFIRRAGKEQKRLDAAGRRENVRDSLFLRRGAKVRGGKFVLCDDVVTTGATAARCASLLYDAGAEEVFILSALRTLPHPASAPSRPTAQTPWFV